MQWLQKFMMGRYGADQLNLALIVLALVLSIVFSIVPLGLIGTLIAMIPLVLAVVRMLSRNRTKRAQENLAFLKLWNPVRNWFQWLYLSIRYCKKNRYFLCPNCGTHRLRAQEDGPRHHHLQGLQDALRPQGVTKTARGLQASASVRALFFYA